MVYIIAVRIAGALRHHQHITHVKWKDAATGQTEFCSRSEMVQWLLIPGNEAKIRVGVLEVPVTIVQAASRYLRTSPDAFGADNLLSLPAF